jgi:hypothetical protein
VVPCAAGRCSRSGLASSSPSLSMIPNRGREEGRRIEIAQR